MARARAHAEMARDQRPHAFVLPEPAPGVLPADAPTMAQDEALAGLYAYADTTRAGAAAARMSEGLGFLGYPYLAELAQRPEYRRMVEITAKEMTRKWIKLTSVGAEDKTEKLTQLGEALTRFRVRDVFRRAAEVDGYFGRAQIFIDTGDMDDRDEMRAPLIVDRAKIKRGGLRGLRVIEPMWTYPGAYNSSNPLSPDFYRPGSWYVMGREIHRSRLLTLVSREMPDSLKPAYSFGGISLSQIAKPYVDNWIRGRQSVSDLLHSYSVSGLKTSLESTLNEGAEGDLADRAVLFMLTRDNQGLMVLDRDTEEFFNVSTPLGTVDKLQAQSQEQMASVAGIPLVKLLGITPSGLNASSDGEIRAFYDWSESQREQLFTDPLQTIIEIVQLHEWGEIDPDIRWHFIPLWQLDEAQRAAERKTNADTAAVYVSAGVLAPEDERRRLAAEEDGLYAGLDPDDMPDAPDEVPDNARTDDDEPDDGEVADAARSATSPGS